MRDLFAAYQPDTTRKADEMVGAFDDPQVLLPGVNGSLTPASLRSNRGDGYARLMMQMANVISFPPGVSRIFNDLLMWVSCAGAFYLVVNLGVPLMPIWFPYVCYGVLGLTILIPSITVCLHRKELIPFLVLRLILICVGLTIVY